MLAQQNSRFFRHAIPVLLCLLSLTINKVAQAQVDLADADKQTDVVIASSNKATFKLKAVETELAEFPKGMTHMETGSKFDVEVFEVITSEDLKGDVGANE